mmetsp:Transcript_28163/g.90015  ORF Transcript_28163/g.90015 Transcript_28163/m.90015 type:complete len:98 (+) Transcript_28163:492-785(+)
MCPNGPSRKCSRGAPLGPGAGILSYLDDAHIFGPTKFAARVARAFAAQSRAIAPGMKLTKVVGFAAGARMPDAAVLPAGVDAAKRAIGCRTTRGSPS